MWINFCLPVYSSISNKYDTKTNMTLKSVNGLCTLQYQMRDWHSPEEAQNWRQPITFAILHTKQDITERSSPLVPMQPTNFWNFLSGLLTNLVHYENTINLVKQNEYSFADTNQGITIHEKTDLRREKLLVYWEEHKSGQWDM